MTVLVYGLGRSGRAALAMAARQGHVVVAYDRSPGEADRAAVDAAGARLTSAPTTEPVDVCIAAPGVPIDHHDLDALRRKGVEVIGEVEWVWRTTRARYLAVTGTAGKGTVTRWLADVLAEAGLPATVGGNFDPALSAVAREGGTFVVEMSSFQLERIASFRPEVAIVLNLGEDHLDRHGTVAAYHAAKRRLVDALGPEGTLVYNADDPVASSWARDVGSTSVGFSLTARSDAWLDGDALVLEGRPLMSRSELRVRGDHQVANALAVALAARAAGADPPAIRRGLARFEGLPGRHMVVFDRDGLRCIDDSIATRELAVRAALEACDPPVVWILGGQDKGARPERLRGIAESRVGLAVAIGASGDRFAASLAGAVHTVRCEQRDGRAAMRCAVARAVAHLRESHGGRGTVLLAPLAASFDQFEDYIDRSRAFREAVTKELTWTPSS